MSTVYSKTILEHYRHPRNFGELPKATHQGYEINPLCGDEITAYLQIQGRKVKDLSFVGRGCALMIASASLTSEKLRNKSVRDIQKFDISNLLESLQIKVSLARESCIMLFLKAINKGLRLN